MSHIKLQHTINIKWDELREGEGRNDRRHHQVGITDDDGNVVCLSWFFKLVFGLGTTVKLSKVPQTDHNMAKQLSSLDRGLGLDDKQQDRKEGRGKRGGDEVVCKNL